MTSNFLQKLPTLSNKNGIRQLLMLEAQNSTYKLANVANLNQ